MKEIETIKEQIKLTPENLTVACDSIAFHNLANQAQDEHRLFLSGDNNIYYVNFPKDIIVKVMLRDHSKSQSFDYYLKDV